MGNFRIFFCSLRERRNLRDHFEKQSRCESSASYVDGTVRVVVFVICKVRKFLMKNTLGGQTAWPHAFETQLALIFLQGAMSQCGLLKDVSERKRESKINGLPRERKYQMFGERSPWLPDKTKETLTRKGIFTENKKGMRTLLKKLGHPQTMAKRHGKCFVNHVILKQN